MIDSIEKSLDEVEFQFISWDYSNIPLKNYEEIRTPAHHALLYSDPAMLTHLQWLLKAPEMIPQICETQFEVLIKYNPDVFVLKKPNFEGDFWVVRVIDETLMPINFGYQYEHYKHKRIESLGLSWEQE